MNSPQPLAVFKPPIPFAGPCWLPFELDDDEEEDDKEAVDKMSGVGVVGGPVL